MSAYLLIWLKMARPLSDEKRSIIIDAAIESVALLGTGASTAKIATLAGVSEGTIFTYFPTKDELLNALYLEIKGDLAQAMLENYPATASLMDRTRHVWDAYTTWGHRHPTKRKAMQQLVVSEKITKVSRSLGVALFEVINALLAESVSTNPLQKRAAMFNGSLLESVATTTLDFMAKEPGEAENYRQAGFTFFWNGLQ